MNDRSDGMTSEVAPTGNGLAIAGLVISLAGIVLIIILVVIIGLGAALSA